MSDYSVYANLGVEIYKFVQFTIILKWVHTRGHSKNVHSEIQNVMNYDDNTSRKFKKI